MHRGRMEGCTTFMSDYVPYNVVKRPPRKQEEYKPKPGKIDLGTTYQRDYNAHETGPLILARPLERKHTTGGKMDTIPTYRDDYRLWKIKRREPCTTERVYQPPTEKFGNPTTFQDCYSPKELNPTQSFKPIWVAKPPDVPFDGVTSHRTDYTVHQLEPKFLRPKEKYKPSEKPFEDLTTHRSDFKGIPGQTAKSCKPGNVKVGSNARFNGLTEFQDRYQPWPVSLPEVHKTREYVPPTGKMDLNSTNHLDYIAHKISPALPIRPVEERRISDPFQGTTTTKDDFRPWRICRREMTKKEQEIEKPTGKFCDLTTFRSHYIPHQAMPAKSCKPVCAIDPNSAPFQDKTTYRTEYIPKKKTTCPASLDLPPGYVYEYTDSDGHQFFHQSTPEHSVSNSNPPPKQVAVVS
ncbi:PREDICTED: protein FAM154A [Acanthisitta chloris]|uniref:protein FAM154A n=1 Tax=Acanthisitta chloris TaxID=57068 RepID=UPI0004F0C87C|nr:PREDICTED: protein FAM154A [Acanthisitta chloris]